MPEETQQQVAAMHPLRRMGMPEDVALATLFLASESSLGSRASHWTWPAVGSWLEAAREHEVHP
jgi:NAD(P)-dependent dehydrogenase (short-subunit alcohol dehydrogenase family)